MKANRRIQVAAAIVLVTAAWVRADITIPNDIGGVTPTGNGAPGTPYSYTFSGALDLGADDILNNTLTDADGNVVFTGITTLTYGAGGTFDWSGTAALNGDERPFLTIGASGLVQIRSATTSLTGVSICVLIAPA